MDELNYSYEDYGKQRSKMEAAGFVFENATVSNGMFSIDVRHKETGRVSHFSVQDGTVSGYNRLTNALSNFEAEVQENLNEFHLTARHYDSKEHKDLLLAEATGYAKTPASKDKLFDLLKAKDAAFLNYLKNPTRETMKTLDAARDAISDFENNKDLCYSYNEAFTRMKDALYDIRHNTKRWDDIINEFGSDSPEAVVAMDMMELEESVKPAEAMFQEALLDSEELEEQIEAAEAYANNVFLQETDKRNFQMFDLRESLAEEQIAEIIEKTPVVREDQTMVQAITDTFHLKNMEGLSQDEINSYVEDFAKKQNDQWVSQHPVLAMIEMLKEIPNKIADARESTIANGEDYKSNVEKVADSVALKAGTFYNSAKMSAVERVQNVAEKSASIYKEACNDFHELVGLAKKEVHKAMANVLKASDIVLDSVTLGAWSNHCEKLEDMAFYKQEKENGAFVATASGKVMSMSMVDPYTYQGQITNMMEKAPNGFFARMEQSFFKRMQTNKDFVKFMQLDDKVNESSAAFMTNLRHKILSGMEGYDSTTYWKEVNDYAFAELQGEKNPADALKELAEKINEKGFELDQKFGVFVDTTVDKTKAKAAEIKDNVVETAEKVKNTFSKEHIDEMRASVVNMCNETKTKILSKKDQMIESVKNSIASGLNKAKEIGKKSLDMTAIGVMSVQVMGLESAASMADKVATFSAQAKRKCEAQINALTEFDKVVHEKIEDINQAINNISSITPRQKVPYEMSEQTKATIETLRSSSDPSPVTKAVLDRTLDKEARKEKLHNAKETVLTGLDTLKTKLSSFVQTAGAKAKLAEMHGWGKAAETAIKGAVDRLMAFDKSHGVADKVANTLTKTAEEYQSKIDDLTDDYQK